jgi:hypothetical protein
VLLVVASCGRGTVDLPEAATVLADARAAMASVESAHFEMAVTGEPILISGLEFASAEGSYAAPDRSTAVLSMRAGDTTIELATIAVAEHIWLTVPLTGAWQEVPAELGFNPAIVFGPEGWDALLGGGLADPRVTEQRDGGWVLVGTAAAPRVEVLTGGQVSGQEVEIEMLVDRDTARVREVTFSTEGAGGRTDWRIGLGPYDEPVDIEPPPVG